MQKDLLNRAASKDWQVYAQLGYADTMNAVGSEAQPEPNSRMDLSGMSDESELNRLGYVAQPVGEVLYDQNDRSDLTELGYMLPKMG